MPIYEYRCSDCGTQKEFLQKLSDAPIANCPACGSSKFAKMLSAAGFQLKGSGWYATDFKGGKKASASEASSGSAASSESKPSEGAPSTPCGGSCACH